jgi:hypothetical protein
MWFQDNKLHESQTPLEGDSWPAQDYGGWAHAAYRHLSSRGHSFEVPILR